MNCLTLLDGGTGQMLIDAGFDNKHCMWASGAIEAAPELVRNVHEDFARAGSQIIYTNTYSLHRIDGKERSGEIIHELMSKNVDILRKLAEKYPIELAISIGPLAVKFHDCSEYTGAYMTDGRASRQDVREHYCSLLRHAAGLRQATVALETIPSLAEVEEALVALAVFPQLRAFVSVTAKDKDKSRAGDALLDIAKTIARSGQVTAFGVNCSDPRLCLPIAKSLSPLLGPNQSLLFKPNDGRTYDNQSGRYVGDTYDLRKDLGELAALRVRYVGGCCTVKPDTIADYRDAIRLYSSTR